MGEPRSEAAPHDRPSLDGAEPWIKPMTPGEVIDTGLRLYQRSAWRILEWTALPMSLCYSAVGFFGAVVVPTLATTSAPSNTGAQALEVAVTLALGIGVALPLFCVGLGLAFGVTVKVAVDLLHGQPANEEAARSSGRSSLRVVVGSLARVLFQSLALVLVAGFFALLGMLAEGLQPGGWLGQVSSAVLAGMTLAVAIVVFPFAAVKRSLAPVIAIVEGANPRAAVDRSRALMRPYRGQGSAGTVTVGIDLLILFVGGTLWATLALLLGATGLESRLESWDAVPGLGQLLGAALSSLPAYLALWLLTPLWATTMTVLYYDRIVRLEAYDIRLMYARISRKGRRSVLLR